VLDCLEALDYLAVLGPDFLVAGVCLYVNIPGFGFTFGHEPRQHLWGLIEFEGGVILE
jgi:hypothetical protein